MTRLDIQLKNMNDVQSFVNITNAYPFHIAVRQDNALIDAKSLMGILSLDHTRPIIVEAYGNEGHVLNDALSAFML